MKRIVAAEIMNHVNVMIVVYMCCNVMMNAYHITKQIRHWVIERDKI